MPIDVNGASSYLGTATGAAQTRDPVAKGFERVSSGQRINSAEDDAAGLAIASRFSREIDALSVASRNAGDGISLAQTADGALENLSENVARIRELALSAANGSLTDQDRQALAAEADQLNDENRGILENSAFNGVSLFDRQSELSIQVGPNNDDRLSIPGNNLGETLNELGLNDIDISTQAGANEALGVLNEATQTISSEASEIGALTNRLESTIANLESTRINASESRSRIADADLARELSDLSANQVREQAGIAIQSQANANQSFVLQLLQ